MVFAKYELRLIGGPRRVAARPTLRVVRNGGLNMHSPICELRLIGGPGRVAARPTLRVVRNGGLNMHSPICERGLVVGYESREAQGLIMGSSHGRVGRTPRFAGVRPTVLYAIAEASWNKASLCRAIDAISSRVGPTFSRSSSTTAARSLWTIDRTILPSSSDADRQKKTPLRDGRICPVARSSARRLDLAAR